MDPLLRALDQRLAALESAPHPAGSVYLGDNLALVSTRWGAKLVVDTRLSRAGDRELNAVSWGECRVGAPSKLAMPTRANTARGES